ncbi:MAG: O-antigen ligase family protein [Chitinophagales bacterium]|nr:O-antigen ligase family protein [Chitinophagales bacterium]
MAQYFLLIYILSISFQRFFFLDRIAYKIQLPEILFVLIAICAYKDISTKIIRIMWPVWLFLGWIWINSLYHNDFDSWMEVLGLTYLSGLALITGSIVERSDTPFLKTVIAVFIIGVTLQVGVGLYGYVLNFLGIHTKLLLFYESYPLIGDVYRMKGYCSHPLSLGNLIITALIFIPFVKIPYRSLWALILGLGLLLTFTKAILIAFAALGFVIAIYINKTNFKRLVLAISFIVLALHVYLTHFTLPLTPFEANQNNKAFYWNNHVVWSFGEKHIYSTSYYVLKQKSIQAVLQHPLMGVGGGNTNDYNLLNYNPSTDVKNIILYDPHSLYFGAAAEYGFVGLALLLLLVYLMGRTLFRLKDKAFKPELFYGFILLYLFFLLEGISSDIINNRQIWIFGGIAIVVFLNFSKESNHTLVSNEYISV